MSLRWSDERYVRLYVRDTPSWLLGPWEARAVLGPVLRKLDRAGTIDLGEDGLDALAIVVALPVEVVRAGMAWWLKRGTFELAGGVLVAPHFLEAQEAASSDAQRAREKRARARDLARMPTVTKRDGTVGDPPEGGAEMGGLAHESEASIVTKRDASVTKRDESSRNVTQPSRRVTPSRTVPSRLNHAEPAGSPPSASLRSAEPPPGASRDAKGSRLPEDWRPAAATIAWAAKQAVDALACLDEFRDHWCSVAGAKGRKLDWDATFRNRVRALIEQGRAPLLPDDPPPPPRPVNAAGVARVGALLEGIGNGGAANGA